MEYYAAEEFPDGRLDFYASEGISSAGGDYEPILAADGETVNGVVITQAGSIPCTADASRQISFTTKLTCDESVKTVDLDEVVLTRSADGCDVTAAFAHAAGCPTTGDLADAAGQITDATEEGLGWLYENEWAVGIIYVVAGPLIALFGASWFPYIVASLVAIFTIGLVCSVSLTAGWMAGSVGTGVTCGVALLLGVIAGCVVRRNFKLMLGLLGLIFGFFSGSLLFALISGMTGGEWNAIWGFWVLSVVLAIVGCVAAIYLGMPLVMIATSMVGSYLFMRAWTLFFPGHYPSEAELVESKGEDYLEMDAVFWVFIGLFGVSFAFSLVYQCKYGKRHQELEDGFNKA